MWLAHTLEHECESVCVLLADRNLIYSNGGVLGCEAVRCEAPAELSSAGAYNTTVSWGPALMAWGALTAIVPSRPYPTMHIENPKPSPPPSTSPQSFSAIQSPSDHTLGFWSGGAHGL